MLFTRRKLVSFLLLVAVLILPLKSLAQSVAPHQAAEDCICAILTDAAVPGESGQQPGPATDNGCGGRGDCGEGEESGSELGELRSSQSSIDNLSAPLRYLNSPPGFVPQVYLSIFVPPES